MLKVIGVITDVLEVQKISDKFSKLDFVVTDYSGMYPNPMLFSLSGERMKALEGFSPGAEVSVQFYPRGAYSKLEDNSKPKLFMTLEAVLIKNV
jgi:hypothetical protein